MSQLQVIEELWNIFTYYSLHGDPLDPEHLRPTQLIKMLSRDCGLCTRETELLEADIHNCYQAEVTRTDKIAPGDARPHSLLKMAPSRPTTVLHTDRKKMNFDDFLNVLMKLSVKIYKREVRTKDEAFEKLLGEKILPLASRRCPEAAVGFMSNAQVMQLFDYYDDALRQIFGYYASSDKRTHRESKEEERSIFQGGRGGGGGVDRVAGSRNPSAQGFRAMNTMKEAMAYPDFLRFASSFELSSNVLLTTYELGDIFLSSLKFSEAELRALSYTEFLQALVRCALVAYSKISSSTVLDKIRGLFLYMWRAINKNVPRAWGDGKRKGSTYTGDLLAGAAIFNRRFTAQWAADGHRDYLTPPPAIHESGRHVLDRAVSNDQSRRYLLGSASGMSGGGGGGGGQEVGGGGGGYYAPPPPPPPPYYGPTDGGYSLSQYGGGF